MKTSRTASTIARAAVALAGAAATPAWAQDAQAADPADIVVTARRVEERLQDVPISITVFNQSQLNDRNIANSTDLATYTPSLTVNARYGPDKASFAIRGFSQDLNTVPTVGVYFADVVAPRLSSNITSGNGAGPGSLFDLQNVQVLKGPQGTLFGRNTTGGAILLVPRRPTDRLEGYAEATYGNFDAWRGQAVLNVPLADGFRVRLGVDRYKRDGYVKNRSGIGPDDFQDIDYLAARLSVLADLTPNLENYTVATYSRSSPNGSIGKLAYCNPGTTGGGGTAPSRAAICAQKAFEDAAGYGYYDVQNSHPDPFVRQRIWQIINTTTWRASDTLTIKNIASYGEAREAYALNVEGDNIAIPFVLTYPGRLGPQGSGSTYTEELQFQGNTSNGRLTWQGGGYAEISDPLGSQEQLTQVLSVCTDVRTFTCSPQVLQLPASLGGPRVIGSISSLRNNYSYRSYGLYGQATYKLTDKLGVTGGFRYTWDQETLKGNAVIVVPSPTGPVRFSCTRAPTPANANASLLDGMQCLRTFTTKSDKPTWLVDLDYKPNDDLLVYAKYARGYRAGGVNESAVGAEVWQPEKVDDYEIGLKASLGGAIRGTFNVAGFWNEFKDQQTSVFIAPCVNGSAGCTNPAPTGINGIQNVGQSRLRGIEADVSLVPFDGLQVDLGYAYLDAKVTGGSVPFCESRVYNCASAEFARAGTILPFAPKNRVTVTGTYTLPLDETVGRVSVGATFTHTDKQFSSHSSDAGFAAGIFPYNASLSPATDLLNLNLNWRGIGGSPVDLALFATNVTREKYYVAASGLTAIGGEFIVLGEPRTYGLRVRYSFGS